MQHDNIVYVVDPDDAIGEALTALLATYGIRVQAFPDAESFQKACPAEGVKHGCLLVEAHLPGSSSLSLLRQLRAHGFNLPVIVLTSTAGRDIRRQALQFCATDVLEKPLIDVYLVERLSQLGRLGLAHARDTHKY